MWREKESERQKEQRSGSERGGPVKSFFDRRTNVGRERV